MKHFRSAFVGIHKGIVNLFAREVLHNNSAFFKGRVREIILKAFSVTWIRVYGEWRVTSFTQSNSNNFLLNGFLSVVVSLFQPVIGSACQWSIIIHLIDVNLSAVSISFYNSDRMIMNSVR